MQVWLPTEACIHFLHETTLNYVKSRNHFSFWVNDMRICFHNFFVFLGIPRNNCDLSSNLFFLCRWWWKDTWNKSRNLYPWIIAPNFELMLVNEFFCADALRNPGFSMLSCQICKCFCKWEGGARDWGFPPQCLLISKRHSRGDWDIRWVVIVKKTRAPPYLWLPIIICNRLALMRIYSTSCRQHCSMTSCLCKLYLEVGPTNICCKFSVWLWNIESDPIYT